MNRPTGVTVLAVLTFIGAGFLALFAAALLLGSALVATLIPPAYARLAGAGGIILAIFFLGLAALYVVLGVGLLKLQNWARVLVIVFDGLGLLTSAFAVLFGLLHPFLFFGLFLRRAVIGAIQLWVLLYLLKPHVKQAFGATGF